MNRLITFNLRHFLRQKSSYSIPVTSMFILILVSLLKSLSDVHAKGTMSGMYLILFFVLTMIFVLYSTLSLFGVKNNEGLNVLIASKPFGRKKIFISKLIANISIVAVNALAMSTLMMFILLIEGKNGISLFLQYVSLIYGSLIISFIFASIVALTTQLFNAQSLSMILLTTIFFIPFASSFATTFLNDTFTGTSNFRYGTFDDDIHGEYFLDSRSYSTPHFDQQAAYDKVKDNPYRILAWMDPWVQLKDLYNVFTDQDSSIIKWSEDKKTLDSNETISLNGKEYVVLIKHPNAQSSRNEAIHSYIVGSNEYKHLFAKNKTTIESLKYEQQLLLFSKIFARGTNPADENAFNSQLNASVNETNVYTSLGSVDYYTYKLWDTIVERDNINFNSTSIDVDNLIQEKNDYRILLFEKGSSINVFVSSPIVPKYAIMIIWFVILVATSSASLYVFNKKD